MLNVLHLVNSASLWGPGRYIISLAGKLHKEKCRIFLGYSTPGLMLQEAEKLGIETIHIPMGSFFDIKAALELKRVCREQSIDVVHTHFFRENCIGVLSKLLGNRMILIKTVHVLNEGNIFKSILNLGFTNFDDVLIAVSEAVKKRLTHEVLAGSKINVIYNGVDPDAWKGRRNLKIRESLGIDRKTFVITSLSRFSEEKGHLFLMESIKRLKRLREAEGTDNKQYVFLLAGKGELMGEYMELAKMLGIDENVIFTGYRSDVRDILHTSDLFISHSMNEGLGLSALEALACGVPVLATDCGGTSEIIDPDKGFGMLVEFGDTEAFAAAVNKFITDREFHKACRDNTAGAITERFSLDYSAGLTYDLYIRSLTSGNR